MKSLPAIVAATAVAIGAAWGVGCAVSGPGPHFSSCPSSGCGTDQRCQMTIDSGSYCCGAPGTNQGGCCYPPDGGAACGCISDYGRTECATDADCCNGHCVRETSNPEHRGSCQMPDGGTADGGTP